MNSYYSIYALKNLYRIIISFWEGWLVSFSKFSNYSKYSKKHRTIRFRQNLRYGVDFPVSQISGLWWNSTYSNYSNYLNYSNYSNYSNYWIFSIYSIYSNSFYFRFSFLVDFDWIGETGIFYYYRYNKNFLQPYPDPVGFYLKYP